ncbi:MAG: 2-oxo acid dehydrogenase subunit E2 [Anaerolineales bacterium]|nr:2-oxo acid dehydrogenase subunit E2 [Anaerolineales bacterium]
MATNIYMPALGMAQTTGRLVNWHKAPGAAVTKGEPLMEIETDKATVEIEAPASGTLANVTAQPGDDVPVGEVVALILAPGEAPPATATLPVNAPAVVKSPPAPPVTASPVMATPVAARMAAELGIELSQITPAGGKIQKSDIEAYLAARTGAQSAVAMPVSRLRASPKARRLGRELHVDLAAVEGSGPGAAVLAADVLAAAQAPHTAEQAGLARATLPISPAWRVMAARLTQAWAATPQFNLTRDVDAGRLVDWRTRVGLSLSVKLTYTDLLVKLTAAALQRHPRLNAAWQDGEIVLNPAINIGLAVAVEAGLLVPVIAAADTLGLGEIAAQREALVARAATGRLNLGDLSGGTFTLTNLGMYGVEAFAAIVNPPQAAILAVGRVADRVVAVQGQPGVRPMLTLTLSCDHRVVDGARAAEFLATLAGLIEEPLGLLS